MADTASPHLTGSEEAPITKFSNSKNSILSPEQTLDAPRDQIPKAKDLKTKQTKAIYVTPRSTKKRKTILTAKAKAAQAEDSPDELGNSAESSDNGERDDYIDFMTTDPKSDFVHMDLVVRFMPSDHACNWLSITNS